MSVFLCAATPPGTLLAPGQSVRPPASTPSDPRPAGEERVKSHQYGVARHSVGRYQRNEVHRVGAVAQHRSLRQDVLSCHGRQQARFHAPRPGSAPENSPSGSLGSVIAIASRCPSSLKWPLGECTRATEGMTPLPSAASPCPASALTGVYTRLQAYVSGGGGPDGP